MQGLNLKGLEMRPVTHRPGYKLVSRAERLLGPPVTRGLGAPPSVDKVRQALGPNIPPGGVGLGREQAATSLHGAGLGSMVDLIRDSLGSPVWNMDVIEQVRWGLDGPQTDFSIGQNFGATIDLFGSGKTVPGIDFVETTFAQPGQTQTFFIACYLGFHMEPTPMCWTTIGNAWTHPSIGAQAPPSPDVWTLNDQNNGALGAAIAAGTQIMVPADMAYGWWGNYACWHMARGYNLRWKIGQHTNIMDEVLRHTAYMPPNAQEGSASSSQVDTPFFINQMNRRYDSLGTALDFLKVDFIRTGSMSVLVGEITENVGDFAPTRDFDLVPATYGGMDLRSLLRGSEFRKLTLPYVLKPGVPIGISLQETDTDQANAMRQFLSITDGQQGSIPPIVTDDPNIDPALFSLTGPRVMLERQLDGPTNTPQQVSVARARYKAGPLKFTQLVKGFEVAEDWYTLMSTNADIREVVASACGIRFAMQGGA
jgi:hypothetical protein